MTHLAQLYVRWATFNFHRAISALRYPLELMLASIVAKNIPKISFFNNFLALFYCLPIVYQLKLPINFRSLFTGIIKSPLGALKNFGSLKEFLGALILGIDANCSVSHPWIPGAFFNYQFNLSSNAFFKTAATQAALHNLELSNGFETNLFEVSQKHVAFSFQKTPSFWIKKKDLPNLYLLVITMFIAGVARVLCEP